MRGLMAERPYAAISVGDVTERATVNRATFYAHYLDKADLAQSVLREDVHEALLRGLSPPRLFDAEGLTRLGVATFEFVAGMRKACPKAADELGVTVQESLQEFVRTWLEHEPSGLRAFSGASVDTVATVVAWSLYGGAIRWSRLTRRPSAEGAVREIVGLLLRSIPVS